MMFAGGLAASDCKAILLLKLAHGMQAQTVMFTVVLGLSVVSTLVVIIVVGVVGVTVAVAVAVTVSVDVVAQWCCSTSITSSSNPVQHPHQYRESEFSFHIFTTLCNARRLSVCLFVCYVKIARQIFTKIYHRCICG